MSDEITLSRFFLQDQTAVAWAARNGHPEKQFDRNGRCGHVIIRGELECSSAARFGVFRADEQGRVHTADAVKVARWEVECLTP